MTYQSGPNGTVCFLHLFRVKQEGIPSQPRKAVGRNRTHRRTENVPCTDAPMEGDDRSGCASQSRFVSRFQTLNDSSTLSHTYLCRLTPSHSLPRALVRPAVSTAVSADHIGTSLWPVGAVGRVHGRLTLADSSRSAHSSRPVE
jgi:hypothetical protein